MQNRVYFVRHAENRANLTKEFSCNKVDYSITPKGKLQAEQTAEFFLDKGIHEIYTSPLKRARETAEIIAARLGIEAQVRENFRETNVGLLEDMGGSEESWRINFAIMADWITGHLDTCFPGGEDGHTLKRRMREGMDAVLAGKDGRNILIVCHGGQLSISLPDLCPRAELSDLFNVDVHNCSITEILMRAVGEHWEGELISFAFSSHLSGEAARLVRGLPE